MLERKQLINNLLIRIVVLIILGVLIFSFSFLVHPHLDEKDVYEVKGQCIDIYEESIYVGKLSFTHKYVVIDDDKYLRVFHDIESCIDRPLTSLIGKEVVFWVSDKSIWYGYKHPIVAWEDASNSKEETLATFNDSSRSARIFTTTFSLLLIGPALIIPQILRISEERDVRMEKIWAKEKKAAMRKRIEDKNLPPLSEQKKRPKNISTKKWKQRKNNNN